MRRTFYVAQNADGSYACEGQRSGWKSIEKTWRIEEARRASTIAALKAWLGGHHFGRVPVKVEEKLTVIGARRWPKKEFHLGD
jgi:hypothetical protein